MERLKKIGQIPRYHAKDVAFSRLGIGFEKLDRDAFDPENAYVPVSELGLKHVRLQSGWIRTEKEKGVYDFSWLDKIVDRLLSLNLKPWLCLCYGNPLYTPAAEKAFGGVGCPPINSQEAADAWLRYVRATVEHFKGRIELYEVWNEPDGFWSWKHYFGEPKEECSLSVNAHEYGVFAMNTAIAVKEADQNAKVAALSLAHPNIAMSYVNEALATGLWRHIDYVTFHIYASHDERRERIIRAIRKVVDLYNPKIGLIQGEAGAQSRSDGNGALKQFAWSQEKQWKMLLRTLICDLYCGVEFSSYFSTLDMIEALHGVAGDKATYLDYGYFGVLSAEFDENGRGTGKYGKKPSYDSLATLSSLMREGAEPAPIAFLPEEFPSRRVNGMDYIEEDLKFYSFRLCDGRKVLFYWNPVHLLTSTFEGTTSMCVFGEDTENFCLADMKDGTLYSIPEDMIERLDDGGIRFINLPLLDSPLALIFGKENK